MTARPRRRIAVLALAVLSAAAAAATAAPKAELFPLDAVRLLPGPFKDAQDVDHKHILAHSPDRLLAPFRKEAGLEPKAPYYPSWESGGLGGQTGGHYLSALSMMYAATGDPELLRRLNYMVAELAECQKAGRTGFIGGTPNAKQLWADIAAGKIKITGFGVNDRWVPWYNVHKTFAGLRDAHLIAGNPQAKEALARLADWCVELISHLSDEQMQQMLGAEHGGMPEVLADVHALTGDERYLKASRRFCHRAILDPLVEQRDDLTGKHANTQIPKVIGFERISSLTGDDSLHRAATFFWQTVTTRRSVAIGGNSVGEHFNPPDNFSTLLQDATGPETCNTYNMLRLTEHLFRAAPEPRYADFYERALYNHILASQHPTRGGFVYFTPMRPRHYRVYSTAEQSMWCCVGTGIENHAKYGSFIYAHTPGALYVNLFIPSELKWDKQGLTVRQETTFPETPSSRLKLSLRQPTTFTLHVRHPAWLAQETFEARVNGDRVSGGSTPGSYLSITREWRDGDMVDLSLPMTVSAERPPDRSNHVAFVYGPVVLAAATDAGDKPDDLFAPPTAGGDNVGSAPLLPLQDAPTLVTGDPASVASRLRPDPAAPLTFTLPADAIQPAGRYDGLRLVPFHRVHETRYVLYFPTYTPAAYAAERKRIEEVERERAALDAITLDRVIPGHQQSEVDHHFKGDRTNHGPFRDRAWRDANNGWFSYELRAPAGASPAELMVMYYGKDHGRTFDIHVGDAKLATVTLDGQRGGDFFTVRYPLPAEALKDPSKPIVVKFTAHPNSTAGGIFDLRLLRK